MTFLTFKVPGAAVPKGSKRAVPIRKRDGATRIAVIEQPKVRDWEMQVREAATYAALANGMTEPSNALVEVETLFTFPRPRSHYGTGRNAETLRASAPAHHGVKPDVDKLARTILDGITGVVLTDDARVVRLLAWKEYGWPVAATITVRWL
jgi:Holliday junction resolvase RusA-like endonuclease